MREVTPETAADYLRETGRVPAGAAVEVRALGWGVSNVVMRVDVEGEPPFVLKQARERLRTRGALGQPARPDLDRARRAGAARRRPARRGRSRGSSSPTRTNYLFAMTCAPDDSVVWKEQLLAGEADPAVARRAGAILGAIHAATRDHPALDGPLADTTVFDELRVDPFYRTIARAHPDLAPRIEALIAVDGAAARPLPSSTPTSARRTSWSTRRG